MTRIRSILAITIAISCNTPASAQFFPPPIVPVIGVPVAVPNGIGFQYRSRRLQVGGFFGNGTYTPGILPIAATGGFPFAPGQPLYLYSPGYFPGAYPGYYPYGSQSSSVTLQVLNPPGVGGFRRALNEEYDINGIDLDLEPPGKVGNKNPAPPARMKVAQRELMAKKVEVAKAPPLPEERKVEANVAQAPAVVAPKPKVVPNGQRWIDQGANSFRDGEYGIAILRFRQAAQENPPVPRALFLQGQACLAVGKYQEAAELIQQGLKLQPDWHQSGFRPKAEMYGNDLERWNQQLKRLEQAQRQQPKNADYLFLLGYLAWFDGDRVAAVAYFRQARTLAADPQWADLFLKAGN